MIKLTDDEVREVAATLADATYTGLGEYRPADGAFVRELPEPDDVDWRNFGVTMNGKAYTVTILGFPVQTGPAIVSTDKATMPHRVGCDWPIGLCRCPVDGA